MVKDPIPFPTVVVPVAAINHVLVLESRIAAFDLGQNVLRFEPAHLVGHRYGDTRRKCDGPEAWRGGLGACFVEIVAGGCEYRSGLSRLTRACACNCWRSLPSRRVMFSRALFSHT